MPSLYAQMPNDLEQPQYKVYRSGPRGLKALLRGEEDVGLGPDRPHLDDRDRGTRRRWFRGRLTWKRALLYLATAVVGWLLLSLVLFIVSAEIERGNVPTLCDRRAELGRQHADLNRHGADPRHRSAPEGLPGARREHQRRRQPLEDTIMLWRIGGGTSRRLSIPRDTVVPIPGHGDDKINAAYAYGGPALAIKTVEQFTGVKVNHLIIVNLAAFPPFINAIGGVDVKTGRVCSEISGGVQKGGFTLNLRPGVHHLNGTQALTYARTRENPCNPADSDLTRVQHQQQILNGIKSQAVVARHVLPAPVGGLGRPQGAAHRHGRPDAARRYSRLQSSAARRRSRCCRLLPASVPGLSASPEATRRAVSKLMNG